MSSRFLWEESLLIERLAWCAKVLWARVTLFSFVESIESIEHLSHLKRSVKQMLDGIHDGIKQGLNQYMHFGALE